jgi:hypothetical protein
MIIPEDDNFQEPVMEPEFFKTSVTRDDKIIKLITLLHYTVRQYEMHGAAAEFICDLVG